jgi:hypothetical protein
MTLLMTVNEKLIRNVVLINVISKIIIGKVFVRQVLMSK